MNLIFHYSLAIRLARALNEIVRPEHSIVHLTDKFGPAANDLDWINALARDGQWILLTAHPVDSPHHRRAWKESGLTVFFLGSGWAVLSPVQQNIKLMTVLSKLFEKASGAKAGAGFGVNENGSIVQVRW